MKPEYRRYFICCPILAILALALLLYPQTSFSQDLFRLIERNDLAAVEAFNDAVNLRDENQATALMWAAYYANLDMVKLLIAKGADVTAKGWIHWQDSINQAEYMYGSLMAIAAGEGKMDLLKFLIHKHNIPVDDREVNLYENTDNGWTALHWAALRQNDEIVGYLIKEGADVNAIAETDMGRTPLIFAVNNGNVSTVNILLAAGASTEYTDGMGNNALDYALMLGDKDLTRIISLEMIIQGIPISEENIQKMEQLLSDSLKQE